MSQMNNEQLAKLLQQAGTTLAALTQRVGSMGDTPQQPAPQPEPPQAVVATIPTPAVKLSSHPAMMEAPPPRDEPKKIVFKEIVEEPRSACKGVTKAGQQCKKVEMPGLNGYCTLHKGQYSPAKSDPKPPTEEKKEPLAEAQKPLSGNASVLEMIAISMKKLTEGGMVTVQYRNAQTQKTIQVVNAVATLLPPYGDRVHRDGAVWQVKKRTWKQGEDGLVKKVVIDIFPVSAYQQSK
jgi:hypothetical protein